MKRVTGRSGPALVRHAILRHRAASSILVLMVLPPVAAQTDYLQALEAEATKISAPSPAVDAGQQADSPVAPADSAPGRDQFEAVLREQYRGTYVFYQELPENAREEFLGEFRRGVPVAELREKIVDRYLQR